MSHRLQQAAGILLLVLSLKGCSEGGTSLWGSLILLLAAIICLPFSRMRAEKAGFRFSRLGRYVIVILGFFLGTALHHAGKAPEPEVSLPEANTSNFAPSPAAGGEAQQAAFSGVIAQEKPQKTPARSRRHASAFAGAPQQTGVTPVVYQKKPRKSPARSRRSSSLKKRTPRKTSYRSRSSYRSATNNYITGPRGGCYYINASGRKVYVDRSNCY